MSAQADIHDRTALVTGAAGGIGWAIARRLSALGYRVALADIDASAVQQRAVDLGDGHVAFGVDLTDQTAAQALPDQAARALGHLDVIVNNAGMTDTSGQRVTDLPDDRFARLVALNLTAVATICAAAPAVLRPGGAIINVASGAAYRALPLRGPYSATKAGVVALTESLAETLADTLADAGLTVTAVAPGYTRTPLLEALHAEGRVDLEAVAATIPLGRLVTPEDVAATVGFLASPEGQSLNGQCVVVDGGGQLGQAPSQGTLPQGQARGGTSIVLGSPDLAKPMGAAQFWPPETSLHEPVATVIDAQALSAPCDAAVALTRLRDTARHCAALAARSRDFSLTVVMAAGRSASDRAESAALTMLARTLALEWAASGMRVNAILWRSEGIATLPALCQYLAGASFVTGQVLQGGDRRQRPA